MNQHEERSSLSRELLEVCQSFEQDLKATTFCLDQGADVNASTPDGSTALIWACLNGHKRIVCLLLDRGADCNITTRYGDTALLWACQWDDAEMIIMLLDRGAEIHWEILELEPALI